ncbi:hypothetical protein TB2_008646 [Malus domestica]
MNSVFSSQCLFVPLPSCQFLPCFQTQPRHMLITMSIAGIIVSLFFLFHFLVFHISLCMLADHLLVLLLHQMKA